MPKIEYCTNKRMLLVGFWGMMICIVLVTIEKAYLGTGYMSIPAVIMMSMFLYGGISQVIKAWKEELGKWNNLKKD